MEDGGGGGWRRSKVASVQLKWMVEVCLCLAEKKYIIIIRRSNNDTSKKEETQQGKGQEGARGCEFKHTCDTQQQRERQRERGNTRIRITSLDGVWE